MVELLEKGHLNRDFIAICCNNCDQGFVVYIREDSNICPYCEQIHDKKEVLKIIREYTSK